MRRHLPLALVLVLVLAGTAGAATIVVVDGPDDQTFRPGSGETVTLDYSIRNGRGNTVEWFADVEAPGGWAASVAPSNATLSSRSKTTITVTFDPGRHAESGEATVRWTVFDRNASEHQEVERTVSLEPQSPARILGVIDNPLPPPLDGVTGAAVLNVVAWAAIVVGAYAAVGPALRRMGGTQIAGNRMRRLVRLPLVVFLALSGLLQTLRILPPERPIVLTISVLETARLLAGIWLGFRVFRTLIVYYRERVAPRTRYELDDMFIPLLEKLGAAFFVAAGVLLLLQNVGVNVSVLLAAGGFASIIIGFAAQNTLSNFFSGINILLDRPFREGDDIELETGEVVRVEKIGLRTTKLYHYRQHELVILPNNDLATKRVVNLIYPDQRYRYSVEVGVAYGTPVELVEDLLYQAADEHPDVLSTPDFEPMVFFDGFGDSSLQFTVRFFINDVRERWRVASEIRGRVDDLFEENDVIIPFPQRTHWFKSTLHHTEGELPQPGRADEGSPDDPGPDDDPGSDDDPPDSDPGGRPSA